MSARSQKILVVVESLDVESSSAAKGRIALINNLHAAGFELKVYHYTRRPIKLDGIETVAIKEQKFNLVYIFSKVQVLLKRHLNININRFFESRLGFPLSFFNDGRSIANSLKKEKKFDPDFVLTLSFAGSFRAHKALLQLPKWHGRWIAYVHDPFPMHSYPRPYDWVEPGHQQKREFFLDVCKKAEYLAYPSKLLAEWMESYYPPAKGKLVIIPHQIDSRLIDTQEYPEFFDPLCFNILHAGSLMSARKPIALARAFIRFLGEVPEAKKNARLIFVGKRSIFHDFFEEIHKNHPQLISSPDYLAFAKVYAMQQAASVNVILEAKGPLSPFLPGKFAHCIKSGKPILLLGPYYSEVRRLLGEDYPYWAEIDDEEAIFSHIKALYTIWANKQMLQLPDRDAHVEYLSPTYLKKVILNLNTSKITYGG